MIDRRIPKRIIRFVATILTALWLLGAGAALSCTAGCGTAAQTQALIMRDATVSANATATTLEAMQSTALVLYRVEQELAIAVALNAGETKAQATARVAVVRKTWAPVWTAFERARDAYDVLVVVLASASPSAAQIQTAVTEQSLRMATVVAELATARKRVQGGVQ